LENGPVYLAQRSRPAAVLLSTEQWDRIAARLEDLETMVDILQSKLEVATGKAAYIDIDLETLETTSDALPA
jgi:PHD/YefM family antitoxin component YafN of YafNO toxin-antitoxin module